jgi:hypothetical protein
MVPASFVSSCSVFQAKWTRFASEARQLSGIGDDTAGPDAPAASALAFAEIAKP